MKYTSSASVAKFPSLMLKHHGAGYLDNMTLAAPYRMLNETPRFRICFWSIDVVGRDP